MQPIASISPSDSRQDGILISLMEFRICQESERCQDLTKLLPCDGNGVSISLSGASSATTKATPVRDLAWTIHSFNLCVALFYILCSFPLINPVPVRPEQSFPPTMPRSLGGLGATAPGKKFRSSTSGHNIFHYSITLDLAHQFRQVTMTYQPLSGFPMVPKGYKL